MKIEREVQEIMEELFLLENRHLRIVVIRSRVLGKQEVYVSRECANGI